jgi:hypothetical protein
MPFGFIGESEFAEMRDICRVEFQNKFYHGDGIQFKPFSYEALFNADEE